MCKEKTEQTIKQNMKAWSNASWATKALDKDPSPIKENINGSSQDCSNSSALIMELLQSRTKAPIYWINLK